MKPVLFTSNKPLERAENIKAVYDAWEDGKVFIRTEPGRHMPGLSSDEYALRVCDEFIGESPGKAVMIGHGIAGSKTYGLDQPRPYHSRKNADLLTWVITTSEAMIPVTARQSGVPESKVLPLGMPRTDRYFGRKKGDGYTFLREKRAYLYAPTFRSAGETPMPEIDWELIDSALTDEEVFVVKPHMMTPHILKREYRHVVEMPNSLPSTPFLIDCDVLITDYSSIMLDAHLLKKPVVLFEKKPGYLKDRGMYLPYPEGYASRYCTDELGLIRIIREARGQGLEDVACMRLTAGACDGHSTERVIDLIRRMI